MLIDEDILLAYADVGMESNSDETSGVLPGLTDHCAFTREGYFAEIYTNGGE